MVQSTVFNWLVGLTVALIVVSVTVGTFSIISFVAVDHQERYITSVDALIDAPTSYEGVKLRFAYHYTKDEGLLRVVISLPDGYPYAALDEVSDSNTLYADHVFPAWACHANPASDDDYASIYARDWGNYGGDNNYGYIWPWSMYLDNEPTECGFWEVAPFDDVLDEYYVYLGHGQCDNGDDDSEECLPDFVGTLEYKLTSAIDLAAWGAKYDAAPR